MTQLILLALLLFQPAAPSPCDGKTIAQSGISFTCTRAAGAVLVTATTSSARTQALLITVSYHWAIGSKVDTYLIPAFSEDGTTPLTVSKYAKLYIPTATVTGIDVAELSTFNSAGIQK